MTPFWMEKIAEVEIPAPLSGIIAANMSTCDTECCAFAAFELKQINFSNYYNKAKYLSLKPHIDRLLNLCNKFDRPTQIRHLSLWALKRLQSCYSASYLIS